MYLEKINIVNFKNLVSISLNFCPNINCFTGLNGAGKTNIIDAIHYLSLCKSSVGLSDLQCVNHGKDFFLLEGEYCFVDEKIENITCSYSRSKGKVLKRANKEYQRLSEHIGLLPVVMISPSDVNLINDASEERRRFINSFISQIDKDYLSSLVRYNGLLAQRNKLLKDPYSINYEVLEVIDMQMASFSDFIYKRRKEFIKDITPIVNSYYREISSDDKDIEIDYKSALESQSAQELFASIIEKDKIMGYTTAGIHRDNIDFKIDSYSIRKYGSQGQQKSFLIALKLAQFNIIANHKSFKPILLLDDIFDKLDLERVEKLINLVSEERFGQIFITDANKVRVENILSNIKGEYLSYVIDKGQVLDKEY
ncbi:MAG: DNA replication and repair protein RecF [Rikenellaceae bacterium]